MSLYSAVVRPILFRLDAETTHHLTVEACRVLGCIPGVPQAVRRCFEFQSPELVSEVAGLRFTTPLGLAAGWDKSGRALRMLDSLGFGFTEIGSISARSSQGNPKPRLFRLPSEPAIIVNYGLPNDGAEVVASRIASHRSRHPLGVNIVKTNDGPNAPDCSEDDILADYERSVSLLHPHASYLMLNLSCPNAEGGKDYFALKGRIARLLERLQPLNVRCPVFLKIAPRDELSEHERVLSECDAFPWIRGFCFNLPTGKPNTLEFSADRKRFEHMPGAVSGRPVSSLIDRCIAGMYKSMDRKRYVIVGTGGVFTADDAYKKIQLGASLIQIYTALIFEGPAVTQRILRDLTKLLRRDGIASISQAVGIAHS